MLDIVVVNYSSEQIIFDLLCYTLITLGSAFPSPPNMTIWSQECSIALSLGYRQFSCSQIYQKNCSQNFCFCWYFLGDSSSDLKHLQHGTCKFLKKIPQIIAVPSTFSLCHDIALCCIISFTIDLHVWFFWLNNCSSNLCMLLCFKIVCCFCVEFEVIFPVSEESIFHKLWKQISSLLYLKQMIWLLQVWTGLLILW